MPFSLSFNPFFGKGIFKPIVKYCLVVTTVEDVLLLALAQDAQGVWQCVATSFVVSSDSVRFSAIVGTETGRIFLGGDDGCLHEFVYEDTTTKDRSFSIQEQLDSFYDDTKDLPAVVSEESGKRPWWQAVTSPSSISDRPRKCRKLNHSGSTNSWLRLSSGVGSSPRTGRVEQLVVDDERQTLSLLTSTGLLQVYDLSKTGGQMLVASCDLVLTTRTYLKFVSLGRNVPPNPPKGPPGRPIGQILFPGGEVAAQMGVGGMDAARSLVQATGARNSHQQGEATSPFLMPARLHVISCRESDRLTLMAVTHGGLRLYLSTLAKNILTTGAVEFTLRRNPNMSPLSPSRQITLCHVRAPPSLDPVAFQKPHTTGLSNWKVDASYHESGQWLVAIEERNNPGKNILVSGLPDSVARKVPEDDPRKPEVLQPSGGLAETVAIPCEEKYLVGGLVWDFCKLPSGTVENDLPGVSELLWHSPTPANANDLDVPPAYYPPSKLSHSTAADRQLAAPQFPTTLRGSALQVLGKTFMNFMLSRPLSHGLAVPALRNTDGGRRVQTDGGDEYRVSKRTGTHGFSGTAEEKAASKMFTGSSGSNRRSTNVSRGSSHPSPSSRNSNSSRSSSRKLAKSARLQQYLLKPMATPLHHMATHHLQSKETQLVALNATGVHRFSLESILSSLANAIIAADERVSDDVTVTNFFKSYSYPEGCAMGLALAIGCGPAAGRVGYAQDLRRLAIIAVMARGHRPKIMLSTAGNGIVRDAVTLETERSPDPFLPPGYEFHPSSLSQGLTRLFARLVRPVWNKPTVVVTEGRMVKFQWSHGSKITPAKVEVLLDQKTLSDILTPLQSLHKLTKDVFKRAIEHVPGTVQRQDSAMDIDDGFNPQGSALMTQALHYRTSVRAGTFPGGMVVELSQKDAEPIAHLIEERNIHSLYRLLGRSVQALHILSLLLEADRLPELPQVEWGLLHGMTFAQLVQTSEGQDRIETLLNGLVVASASSAASLSYSAQADEMARRFADNCYLFFPPASRFAYHGIRFAMEALACKPSSSRREELATKAASNLTEAAKHWYSATLISGRLIRSRGNESQKEIVDRAALHGSPLAKAADLLIQLGCVASVVEICLLTASNFQSRRSTPRVRDVKDLEGVFGWELDLYHKNRGDTQAETTGAQSSPRSSDSYGASVSEKDAIDTCYAIVLYHLSFLLVSNRPLADRMVSACTSYTDKEFLAEMFKFLLDNNHADVLLRINSPDVEKFLRDKNDPELLSQYFDIQGKEVESGRVSYDHAVSKDSSLKLKDRIQFLFRASGSLNSASKGANFQTSDASFEEFSRLKQEVEDSLTAANIQHRILQAIESCPDFEREFLSDKKELETSLLDISTLYETAASIPLTDICLVILHRCRKEDPQTIALLWTTRLCEKLLPMSTRLEDAFQILSKLANGVSRENAVELIEGPGRGSSGYRLFEDVEWKAELESSIQIIGKELYGSGADYTFPVEFLMDMLELLRKPCPEKFEPSWSLRVLAEAGVPYLSLIEIFKMIAMRKERQTTRSEGSTIIDSLAVQLNFVNFWLDKCTSVDDQSSRSKQELTRAIGTGEIQSILLGIQMKIKVTPGAEDLLYELQTIEDRLPFQ